MDIQQIRKDFPILQEKIYGKPLVYLDNAATTQKPIQLINVLNQFYLKYNSNIHRGIHYLSEKSTEGYENARRNIQQFINAKESHEIIFSKGATESINLVANSFGEKFIKKGDEVIISSLEHHSNIVPWQMVCKKRGAKLKVIPINEKGELKINELDKLISDKTKIITVNHISNALGTINPIKKIIAKAHKHDIPVLIDGAQAVPHLPVDVQDLDCDFYVFSGHKMYGPTGTGILYGKEKWLEQMPPYQGGGEMIQTVTFEKTTYNKLPFKFEAGTPNYIDAIGLSTSIDYLTKLGLERIGTYEAELLQYATKKLSSIDGLTIYGTSKQKASVISFLIKGIHPYDMGMILDKAGIAVRTGNHCAQPLMDLFSIQGTVRASFAFYNTKGEIDVLYENLLKIVKIFNR